MAKLPSNLPDILRKHGLKVVEIAGWRDRGVDGPFNPVGVLCHHTAGHDDLGDAADDLAYVKNVLVKGRSDLRGPLCQLALSAEGVVYIVAAGRANHAGNAKASGTVASGNGNTLYIGIEAMNAGTGRDDWEKSQYEAYVLLCAVLSLEVTGNSAQTVRAHKETSVTGKIDPAGPIGYLKEREFDMGKFRARVAAKMDVLRKDGSVVDAWKWNPEVVSNLALVQEQFQIAAGFKQGKTMRYHGVAAIQNALNVKNGENLAVDGICDTQTVAAWKRWETKNVGTGRSTTPDEVSLKKLGILYRFEVPKAAEPVKPAPVTHQVKVMTWNVENTGDADAKLDREAVIKLLNERKPHYFAGQEVYRVDLSNIPGYQTYQAREGYSVNSENRAQAILVRNDVDLKVRNALQMHEEWTGPKMGVEKEPRVHRYVTGNLHEANIPFATFHVPFRHNGDPAPIEETRQAAIKWLKEMKAAHGIAFAVGDWNALAADLQAKVGTPAGATANGGGLDKVLSAGAKLVKGVNLGNRGRSDHDAKEWTFEFTV